MAEQGNDEIGRLSTAVDRFAAAMKEKLAQKARAGFAGWDDPASLPMIREMLGQHVERGPEQAVDIGNLAMMLYWHQVGATEQETAAPFKHITVHIIWDSDRDDKGEPVDFVNAIDVIGPGPDGKPISLDYQDEPSMVMVEFWRWLADTHGWTIDDR